MNNLYTKISSWKIFSKPIKIGDRLRLTKHQMPFGEMIEDENGVFVFLPPLSDFNNEEVNKIYQEVQNNFDKLNKIRSND